ncbi:MAG: S1/P1 Nuclease [Chitinophagaceae bacterium]|uniref:zinc dependent phospholipase C family protein n=1 Tax=unclassified Paraflavitalea TaxID=2798305 RepID=UPI003D344AB7|nr:S1/P1 Nuclease [Chitinophagaceae bacterium]
MKRLLLSLLCLLLCSKAWCWGFFGHERINELAIYLLPPELIAFFKPNKDYLVAHATDPDKRRYAVAPEGARHYLDLDRYGTYPYDSLPRTWNAAVAKFGEDSLNKHGIVPWWVDVMKRRLTAAFEKKNASLILKLSAEIGHYIADAHVPLHASSNHNGQLTNQRGIHGFWESRLPELWANTSYDFFIDKAQYLNDPLGFIWKRIEESGLAADTVLRYEKELQLLYPEQQRYAFEERNGKTIKQYSTGYSLAYHTKLNGMVERRMRASIFAVASFWYTAWVDAGQPNLKGLNRAEWTVEDQKELEELEKAWKKGTILGKDCEEF